MNWLGDQHREDALRHRANAARHIAQSRPEYAVGSMLKARRFERRAREADYRYSNVFVVDELMRRGASPEVARIIAGRFDVCSKEAHKFMARMLFGSPAAACHGRP